MLTSLLCKRIVKSKRKENQNVIDEKVMKRRSENKREGVCGIGKRKQENRNEIEKVIWKTKIEKKLW